MQAAIIAGYFSGLSLIAAIFLRVTLDSLHDLQFQLIHSDSIGNAAAFFRLHDGFIPSNDIEAGRRTALLLVALIAPGIWWLFSLSSHPKTAERLGPYIALATTHMASGFFMTFMLGSFGWVMAASFFLPLRTLQAITLIFWKQKQLETSEPANSMPPSHGSAAGRRADRPCRRVSLRVPGTPCCRPPR
ncbi:MAG: hypothetical protein EBU97_00160 [Rhodobacteraceae bacterium]|nr:hypothetical protein [Paracoccaceae bacterium]